MFEDKSIIRRRILVDESDNNLAEAQALCELLSFLSYYNMEKGLILFDSNGVKHQIKKKGRKPHNHIQKYIIETLRELQLKTQLIPRKWNFAHKLSYEDKFQTSNNVSEINRSYYSLVPGYHEHFMQLSVLDEYRQLYKERYATFHKVQMRINKLIWLAEIIEEYGDFKIYEVHDRRIKVYRDTIVKLSRVNYVRISNHWRVIRRGGEFKKMLND